MTILRTRVQPFRHFARRVVQYSARHFFERVAYRSFSLAVVDDLARCRRRGRDQARLLLERPWCVLVATL
jgi:hypothetical protein